MDNAETPIQEEDKNNLNNTTQKTKKMNNTNPPTIWGELRLFAKGRHAQILSLMMHPHVIHIVNICLASQS